MEWNGSTEVIVGDIMVVLWNFGAYFDGSGRYFKIIRFLLNIGNVNKLVRLYNFEWYDIDGF